MYETSIGGLMDKRDKNLLRSYTAQVAKLTTDLAEIGVGLKDKELSRALAAIAGDLHYVTVDIDDTIDRLN